MARPDNADELVSQFHALTQAEVAVAADYLGASNWDLEASVERYYADYEASTNSRPDAAEEEEEAQDATPGGGRTLGGDGVPSRRVAPQTSAAAGASTGSSNKKFGSLRDFAGASSAAAAQNDDSDEDPDLYAGGEKSGLAVQNPDDLKRKILEKARRQAAEGGLPDDDPAASQRSNFTGRAQTLGGDDTPSRVIEDPNANARRPLTRVQRTLHFWSDGFSVDDGPLYRSDDPTNAARLEMINMGRAPYDILTVERNQEADVKLEQHEGNYVQPKKKYKPFGGQGQRLGSPTPGVSAASEPTSAPVAAAPSASAPSSAASPSFAVDSSQPTVRIQVRLADGTRLVSQFNTSHTVGDIYSFVSSSNAASQSRTWVLASTFPNKDLNDKSEVIGESPELKKGGAIVQKWT